MGGGGGGGALLRLVFGPVGYSISSLRMVLFLTLKRDRKFSNIALEATQNCNSDLAASRAQVSSEEYELQGAEASPLELPDGSEGRRWRTSPHQRPQLCTSAGQ